MFLALLLGGVTITLSSVQRFCERAIARRPRAGTVPQPLDSKPFSIQQTTTTETKTEPQKHRFKLDI